MNKPPYGFCAHLFFVSTIILIFGGLFLHRLYRLLKVKINCLRVSTTEFDRKKFRTRRYNPNPINLSWKARKNPPKGKTKNRPFFSAQFQRTGYVTHYLQERNTHNKLDLNMVDHNSEWITMKMLKYAQMKTYLLKT